MELLPCTGHPLACRALHPVLSASKYAVCTAHHPLHPPARWVLHHSITKALCNPGGCSSTGRRNRGAWGEGERSQLAWRRERWKAACLRCAVIMKGGGGI